MAAQMEFCLLGPLVVRCGGAVVPVAPGKQRAVLAALLLNARRVVSLDELTEVLWGTGPPPSARVTLQNYVKRLRQSLGTAGGSRICTEPGGYQVVLKTGELDTFRFEELTGSARAAVRRGAWDLAAQQARAALSLWRGEPLADVPSDLLSLREAPRLAEARRQALETRIEADLHLGQHAEVIGELRRLADTDPLREHLHALLMLALYRDGRQAEALAAYTDARDVLVDELGTEPGTELRELQRRILSADPGLADPGPGQRANSDQRRIVPRQLPAAVPHFTGRAAELTALAGLTGPPGRTGPPAPGTAGTVLISAIDGTAGVGKSALAVHWAHQVAGLFPDGQLYVNLRGYDPGQPMSPADALAGFLRTLGVSDPEIPAELAERAARYRSLLAGRRMLVLLDNASQVEQVRPLLPGATGCVCLVTSRDSLAGLVAREGAGRLSLDLLPLAEAVGLLRTLIGERAAADPGATAALAAQCSRLPLALRVAAELALVRPDASLAGLVAELADQQRRLDLLNAEGDPRTAVRSVFSWSYRQLDPEAARAFRLAGLHPGSDLDRYALAALTGGTARRAGDLLGELARAHLIQPARPGRHTLHDLLRAYAREAAAQHDPDESGEALTRLFVYYLTTAAGAVDLILPGRGNRCPGMPEPVTPAPALADPAMARSWLDAERDTLVATAAYAAARDWPDYAIRLATVLSPYLEVGSHYSDATVIHTHALLAARRTGDRAAEAGVLASLGACDFRQGHGQHATARYQQALDVFRETSDRAGEARALNNFGYSCLQQGRLPEAAVLLRRALVISREIGDKYLEAHALHNLGDTGLRHGDYRRAARYLQQALAVSAELGDPDCAAYALADLGVIDWQQGRYRRAGDRLGQALALFREISDRAGQAHALINLGAASLRQEHFQRAAEYQRQALDLAREIGDWSGEAEALNGMGEILLAEGRPVDALASHTTALGLADQADDQMQRARAQLGLGQAHAAAGDPGRARGHWREALAWYAAVGSGEADQVRLRLTEAGERGGSRT